MKLKEQLFKTYPELKEDMKDIVEIEPCNDGMSGSLVYKLLDNHNQSTYLKITRDDRVPHYLLERNPYFLESEYLFYTQIVPNLNTELFPSILGNGIIKGERNYLIIEDISNNFEFYKEGHQWTEEEFKSILKTYANIHARGEIALDEQEYEFLGMDIREKLTKANVYDCFKQLYENDWTHEYVKNLYTHSNFKKLIEQVETSLNHLPATINYNDFYPLNIGYNSKNQSAVIIDWQLVGKGPTYIDLCDIGLFSEGFNKYGLNQDEMLRYYLKEYNHVANKEIKYEQFYTECRYANLIKWGVFLTNIVHVMHECNKHNSQFDDWMLEQFKGCVYAWSSSFDLINKE